MTDEERQTTSRCAFCGGADASHRVRDAMLERFLAGDELINIQLDFEDPQAQVKIRQAMKEREASARAEGVAEGRVAGLREAAGLLVMNSVHDLDSWIVGPNCLIHELEQRAEKGAPA